jgi:hypothetical protein
MEVAPDTYISHHTSCTNTLDDTFDSRYRHTQKIACLEDAFPFLTDIYFYLGMEEPGTGWAEEEKGTFHRGILSLV